MFHACLRHLSPVVLAVVACGESAQALEPLSNVDAVRAVSMVTCAAPCRDARRSSRQRSTRHCPHGRYGSRYYPPDDTDSDTPSELAPDLPAPGEDFTPETAPTAPDFGDLASNFGVARGPESFAPGMLGDFLTGGSMSGPILFVGPGFTPPIITPPVITPPNPPVTSPSPDPSNPDPPLTDPIPAPDPNAPPAIPGRFELNRRAAAPYAFHTFKIGDNESPWPRSRVYFTSNYFNHVGDSTAVTRQMLGFERIVLDGNGSIGMRLPFFTADPAALSSPTFDGGTIGSFGADTSAQGNIGDLSIIFKYALLMDRQGGNVLSAGLAITAPTGPATIGGVEPLYVVDGVKHRGTIQPYVGLYHSLGGGFDGLFIHGFSAIDAPFDAQDATYWYNDLGLGYFIQRPRRRGLTAIIPTLEAHVNTPISHTTHSVSASPLLLELTTQPGLQMEPLLNTALGHLRYHNQVNLTSGLTFVFNRRSTVALGVVTPVGGPNPYHYELQAQVNFFRAPWQPGGMLGR